MATAERVAHELREQIVEGLYPPSAPLRESALAAAFNVSRNTLRECFRLLTAEGLVEQRLHRGSVVASIAADQVRDIYTVRRTLELRAIEESVVARERSLDALEAAVAAGEKAVARNEWQRVGTASLRFHQGVVGLLGSPRLDAFFQTIVAQLRLAFASARDEATFQAPWIERDRAIYLLVRSGRRDKAGTEMRAYLDDSERQVLDFIRASADRPMPTRTRRRHQASVASGTLRGL